MSDGNVDPVAIEVTVLADDHVTEVEPDPQLELTAVRGKLILHLNRASRSGQGTGELRERAVTRRLDQAAAVAGVAGLDHLAPEPLELGVGGFPRSLHQRGITDNVCGQDGQLTAVESDPRAKPAPSTQGLSADIKSHQWAAPPADFLLNWLFGR
ncbi:hypothetical protein [Bradyrhizobium septentrionale]|uniref:Uncharacterized protein n=1 Tax=Bradyrhizobium septentrionale TaxID=1404411 RepID=A0ABZ2NUP4_9BRAD